MLSPELQKRAHELTQAVNTPPTEDPPPVLLQTFIFSCRYNTQRACSLHGTRPR